MKSLPVAFLLLLIVCSCSTKKEVLTEYVYVEKTDSLRQLTSRIDSLLKESHQRDSIYQKDSVAVVIKGDTVMIDRWHTVYRERSTAYTHKEMEIIHDTVFQTRTVYIDRVETQTEIQEVNRLKWWQTSLMWIGVASLGLGALLVILKVRK